MNTDDFEFEFDPVTALGREVRLSAGQLDRDSARYLVGTYYRWQEHRITLNNQVRTLTLAEQPVGVLTHFATQAATLEKQLIASLLTWVKERVEGRWALAQKGIGPVLAAGLSAHIDITRAETAGAIWRYAGLDPTSEWLGKERAAELVNEFVPPRAPVTRAVVETIAARTGRRFEYLVRWSMPKSDDIDERVRRSFTDEEWPERWITRQGLINALARRPYNDELKTLCWKIGDCIMKASNREGAFYGKIYRERKMLEVARNEQRLFADQAARSLATRNITDKKLRETYEDGRLPAGRLELRAERYATKLFLAHWFEVAYEAHHGRPAPVPYPIAILGHAHRIDPPPGE